MLGKCLLLFLFMAGSVLAGDKPLHLSTTEIDYDRSEQTAKLSVRVDAKDLETALSRFSDQKISIKQPDQLAPVALSYLRQKLKITPAKGDAAPLQWAGLDISDSHIWLFLEMPLPHGLKGASFGNTLLQELHDDQINTIKLLDGAFKQTLVFGRDTGTLKAGATP